MEHRLHKPIGVFDAGIGSYAIVQEIQRAHPAQDLLYLADRASFPYGSKTKDELAAAVLAAIEALAARGAAAVVLASNAPSVVVLDTLQDRLPLPVGGVYPPVREALRASRSGHVAVLGVQSLVSSAEIQAYIRREAAGARVETANASPLVEHVENGDFLARPAPTQAAVDRYMADLRRRWPDVDACTLSSTHLPWLRPYFERAAPGMHFIDPAQSVVEQLRPRFSQGQGRVVCLATESAAHPLSGLQAMLDTLGVRLKPELISLQ